MSQPGPGPAGRRAACVPRRWLLARLPVAVAALATPVATGCTPSDPRVRPPTSSAGSRTAGGGSTTAEPTSSAAARPGWADTEEALARLSGAILDPARHLRLTGAQRSTLRAVRQAHLDHAAALRSPQPARTTGPAPVPSRTTPGAAVAMLARQERAQAGRLRAAALSAAGPDALLLGSMAVAASTYAGAVVADPARAVVHPGPHPPMAPIAPVADVAAIQSMVTQLHAMIYGYQLALGQLSRRTPAGRRARAGLAGHRRLRDRLVRTLLARSASVPAAAPVYKASVRPGDAAGAAALIRRMETALQPFCGLWLASAARRDDRRLALDVLAVTVARAQSWGGEVSAWPGWPG